MNVSNDRKLSDNEPMPVMEDGKDNRSGSFASNSSIKELNKVVGENIEQLAPDHNPFTPV